MGKLPTAIILLYLNYSLAFRNKTKPDVADQLNQYGTADVMVQCQDVSGTKRETFLIRETFENIQKLVASTTNTRTRIGGSLLTNLILQQQALALEFLSKVTELLDELLITYKIFWIPLVIYIPGATWPVINKVVEVDIVVSIRLEQIIPRRSPAPSKPVTPPITGNTTWNLGLTNTRCPSITKLGTGVVISIIDGGVLWDHEQLKDNFKHNDYSWWDTEKPATSPLPRDTDGHGTFVTGCAVGKDIGVAPDAKWTACLACGAEGCQFSTLYECMEWVACPWRWNDTSSDKSSKNATERPDVVNMSIGVPIGSQVMYPSFDPFFKYIAYWNMIGIVSTFSAGNSGPACGSMGYPASYHIAFAVGSVDANATIAMYSSRGPVLSAEGPWYNSTSSEGSSVFVPPSLVLCTNSSLGTSPIYQIIKPDIVAPGSHIRSSWFTGVTDYYVADGTSFSAPHVAGIMALVIATNTSYPWNYTVVYNLLLKTATHDINNLHGVGPYVTEAGHAKDSNILCNFWTSGICNLWRNNVYGKGLANACLAVQEANKLGVSNKI